MQKSPFSLLKISNKIHDFMENHHNTHTHQIAMYIPVEYPTKMLHFPQRIPHYRTKNSFIMFKKIPKIYDFISHHQNAPLHHIDILVSMVGPTKPTRKLKMCSKKKNRHVVIFVVILKHLLCVLLHKWQVWTLTKWNCPQMKCH